MWVVIFVLGKPQRSEEATKRSIMVMMTFCFFHRFRNYAWRIAVDMDAVVTLEFDWPMSKILRFLVKIKVSHLFLSRYIYMLNFSMTTHKNARNIERSVLGYPKRPAIFSWGYDGRPPLISVWEIIMNSTTSPRGNSSP